MAQKTANQLRIIGGDWRSRRFAFSDALGLRPNPHHVPGTQVHTCRRYRGLQDA